MFKEFMSVFIHEKELEANSKKNIEFTDLLDLLDDQTIVDKLVQEYGTEANIRNEYNHFCYYNSTELSQIITLN